MTEFEVIIVGGGIAGCVTAIHLRQTGVRVGLILRQHEELRGYESLAPSAVLDLNALGIEEGDPLPTVIAWWGSDTPKQTQHKGARVIQRAVLCEVLQKQADACGVVRLTIDEPFTVQQNSGRWSLVLSSARTLVMTAPYIVDATGRSSIVARSIGSHRNTVDQLCSISTSIANDNCVGTWTESTRDGWWNVCGGYGGAILSFFSTPNTIQDARRRLSTYFEATKHLRRYFSFPDTNLTSIRTCNSSVLVPCSGVGWFAIGDAANTIQPLTSAGISKAIRDARLVARCLQSAPTRYELFQRAEFGTYLRSLHAHYSLEKRWADSPFWLGCHQENSYLRD